MKKLLLILLCLPFLFSCGGKKQDNDLGTLKGKVKICSEIIFEAKEAFGDLVKGEKFNTPHTKTKYDEYGNKTEVSSYDKDGKLWLYSSKKYKYDEDGNKTEESSYDKDGGLTSKSKYKYDEDSNLTEYSSYNKDGELTSKSKYKYDEDGNLTESNRYDKDGKLNSKSNYKYDDVGNWTESYSSYDKDGKLICNKKLKYDEYGNIIESGSYDKDGKPNSNINNYNKTYKYDEYENITEMEGVFFMTCCNPTIKFSEKYKSSFKYEFDQKNNWIVRKYYGLNTDPLLKEKKHLMIVEREIEYYE